MQRYGRFAQCNNPMDSAAATPTSRPDARFQVLLAAGFLLIAIAGFARSYLLRVADGHYQAPPIFHLHGMLMFAWFSLFLLQSLSGTTRQYARHRAWGLVGVALFTALVCSTVALNIHSMHRDLARAGGALQALGMPAATFLTLALAMTLFAWAIASARKSQTHRRVMVLLMIVMLQAAVSRLAVQPFFAGPPNIALIQATALATAPLLVLVLWRDWHVQRRHHAVYLWGGLMVLVVELLIPLVGCSGTGIRMAVAIGRLSG
jgi:hypothetical protein